MTWEAREPAADGGAKGIRTPDLLNAIEALYQLSYDPLPQAGAESARRCVARQGIFWKRTSAVAIPRPGATLWT
jgi:hypothetical protein